MTFSAQTILDHRDVTEGDAKSFGYVSNGSTVLKYLRHLLVRKFTLRSPRSVSFLHIIHVLLVRSKKQVVGVYAGRVITRMSDLHSGAYQAVVPFIRQAMGPKQIIAPKADNAVPAVRCSASPRPAFIGSAPINLFPKSLRQRTARPSGRVGPTALRRAIFCYPNSVRLNIIGSVANRAFHFNHRRMLTCLAR